MIEESGGLKPSACAVTRQNESREWIRFDSTDCSRESVGNEVDPEKLHRDESFRHTQNDRQDDLSDIGGDEISDELFRVLIDRSSLLDGTFDGREIVVRENHIRGELGD